MGAAQQPFPRAMPRQPPPHRRRHPYTHSCTLTPAQRHLSAHGRSAPTQVLRFTYRPPSTTSRLSGSPARGGAQARTTLNPEAGQGPSLPQPHSLPARATGFAKPLGPQQAVLTPGCLPCAPRAQALPEGEADTNIPILQEGRSGVSIPHFTEGKTEIWGHEQEPVPKCCFYDHHSAQLGEALVTSWARPLGLMTGLARGPQADAGGPGAQQGPQGWHVLLGTQLWFGEDQGNPTPPSEGPDSGTL